MLNLESKTATVKGSQQAVYNHLSDFRNFAHLLPADQLQDLEVTSDTLRFGVSGMGKIGLKIAERQPCDLLTLSTTEGSLADFILGIHIQAASENISEVKFKLEARMNMFMEMLAKAPLEHLLELFTEKISTMEFK